MDRSISAYSKPFYSMVHTKCKYPLAYVIKDNTLMHIKKNINRHSITLRIYVDDIQAEIETDLYGGLAIVQSHRTRLSVGDNCIPEDDLLDYIIKLIKESKSRIYIPSAPHLSRKDCWTIYDEL